MKKLLLALLVLFAFYQYIFHTPSNGYVPSKDTIVTPIAAQIPTKENEVLPSKQSSRSTLERAIQQQRSQVQVEGSGRVVKVLRDDLKGSRHQKFILRIASGSTVLITHNIDLAPRIQGLRKGDVVKFNGQYEWNPKGGVIHWTHHDPNKRHVGGWLKHQGRLYQ